MGNKYTSLASLATSNIAIIRPDLAAQWHSTKNSVSPQEITIGSPRKVWWICSIGHEWESRISDRSAGKGCPYCSGRKATATNNLEYLRPDLAKEWHPTRNDVLPDEVTVGSNKKYWWICSKGHEWESAPNSRSTLSNGCPHCNKTSKGERSIKQYLDSLEVYHRREFRFTNCKNIMSLPFDFVILPDGKGAGLIEYQGRQHYKPLKIFGGETALAQLQIRDQIKRDFCKEKGLLLLEIPYWEIKSIPRLLTEFIESLPPRSL